MYNLLAFIAKTLFKPPGSKDLAAAIIPQYQPPEDLTAAELGLLVDQRGGRLEFIATIYQLKTKKIIALSRDGTESLRMKLLQYSTTELTSYEDMLLRYFFHESREVSLEDYFHRQDYAFVQSYFQYQVMQSLQRKGYLFIETGYESQPYTEFLAKVMKNPLAYIINSLKNGVRKNLTEKARQSFPLLDGFKNYIETAEIDKIKFHAQGNLEQYIELLTPYAIVFHQMERWQLVNIPLFIVLKPEQIKGAEYTPEAHAPQTYMAEVTSAIAEIDSYTLSAG